MQRLAFSWLAAAVAVAVTPAAHAAGPMTSLMGGRTFGMQPEEQVKHYAARAELGWPNLRLTYVVPFLDDLDVSPQFTMIYGRNLRAGVVGFEPGLEVRWNVWQQGEYSLAFYADPALLVWVPTDGEAGQVGLRLGAPGIVGGWQLASHINVFGGLKAPLSVAFGADTQVLLPVTAEAGFEVQAFRSEDVGVNATGLLAVGPELCLTGCDRSAELTLRVGLGASVVW